jgi:hypothetical protein
MTRLYWDRGILTDKTVLHNRSHITFFEKTNKIVYLIDVSVPNSGDVQTAYTEKIRKYAELNIEVKKIVARDAVYTLPVTISATGVILHTLHVVLKRLDLPDWLYVTIQRSVILNTRNIVVMFLGDSTFHQYMIHILTFTFVIKRVRYYDSDVLNKS